MTFGLKRGINTFAPKTAQLWTKMGCVERSAVLRMFLGIHRNVLKTQAVVDKNNFADCA